jgi:endonuclease/exonuclease/phosphatase family metal-dependent hydrolase
MATRICRPLKVIAFNANVIVRQRYELSKQLQDLHVNVALFSKTHLKRHERLFISNYHFYRTDRHPDRKGGTLATVRRGVPHNHVDLLPLVSVEATGVCIPIGNSEVLLASVYKSPARAWSDADITELLSFRCKSILAGDLNAKHPFWKSAVSNPSGEKLMALFDLSEFDISAPQYPTHYSPAENGDVLDIVFHQNIRVSDVIVCDILDSDHLPIISHIIDHVKIKNLSDPIEKFADGDRFQSLISELISSRIKLIRRYKPIKRRATLQPLFVHHIGWRAAKLDCRS